MTMVSSPKSLLSGRELTADDEENLRRHAARGAQAAVQAAKDRAKQFDNAGQTVDLDSEPSPALRDHS